MNRIKEILEQKGIKQVWLAEQLGKSYNIVNGTNKKADNLNKKPIGRCY